MVLHLLQGFIVFPDLSPSPVDFGSTGAPVIPEAISAVSGHPADAPRAAHVRVAEADEVRHHVAADPEEPASDPEGLAGQRGGGEVGAHRHPGQPGSHPCVL